jgi:hypothetical protein
VAESEISGDRTHRFVAPMWVVFDALTLDVGAWLGLERGEVAPRIVKALPPGRVVWSSLWPVSPDDTVEFELSRYGVGTELRFVWRSPSPPGERGIGITRQGLDRKFGDGLRGWVDSGSSPE